MANKDTLRYLPVALDDLILIFDWIANDTPANAAAFIKMCQNTPQLCWGDEWPTLSPGGDHYTRLTQGGEVTY